MTFTHEELLALAASARKVMTADGTISEGESDLVARFAPRVGLTDAKWQAVWDEATRTIPLSEAMDAAAAVTRPEAREKVYELLHQLATDGSITDSEWDVLEWLDDAWR